MRRRVTVDSTKSVRDSAESRRPSVFERLGPGAGRDHHRDRDSSRADKCRNWLRDGHCPYGDTCHFAHGPYSQSRDRDRERERDRERLSDSDPPMDLRHRVESKRAERERHERETWDDDDRSDTPPAKEEKRRRSRRDKDSSEKKKKKKKKREMSSMVVKQDRSSSSSSDEGDGKDWRPQDEEQSSGGPEREDPDFEYQLVLERRRQQLQRELEQMEMEENQSDRDPLEDDNSNDDRAPKASSPPKKKHKKKRSHSNSSKHERQATEDLEVAPAPGKKKKHKHLTVDTSPSPTGPAITCDNLRSVESYDQIGSCVAVLNNGQQWRTDRSSSPTSRTTTYDHAATDYNYQSQVDRNLSRDMEKVSEHHGKKKSRKSKSPMAASKARSPSPPLVLPSKPDDTPKKHKVKEGKKKDKVKKRKYQSETSEDEKDDFEEKKRSTSNSRKKSSSKRRESPKRSPSRSPPRRKRDPSPSSQSESSQASTRRGKSPVSVSGSHASESPKRSKKRYHSPSPKRSRQPTPEMHPQSRHSRRASPESSHHQPRSISRGQSPSQKKRARSTSIGSSQRSQSPAREHRRSPSIPKKQTSSSRGRGSPGRDASRGRVDQRRPPPERMPPDGGRMKGGYDKYDNKRPYSQDRNRSSSTQMRDGRPPGRDVRDGPSRRDPSIGDRGFPPNKDSRDVGRAPPPGRNERVSRREDWEKKRGRDGSRDMRDEPYNKRPRSDTRGTPPPPQTHRQYGREDEAHSAERHPPGNRFGNHGNHNRSTSLQQHLTRQDRERSGSRRPDFPPQDQRGGRDNTPDFRRAEHLNEGRRGRDGTPDARRPEYGVDSKGRGRDNTPDMRRQDFSQDGRNKGRDGTPDKRHIDYQDRGRTGRDGTPADIRRSEQDGGRKGRDNTPDNRQTPDKRRGGGVGGEKKGEGFGKYEDKRDLKIYDERSKEPGRDQKRDDSIRGSDVHRDSRSRDSSRAPSVKEDQPEPPPPQPAQVPPVVAPKPVEQPKREKLKSKTDSIESKISSSASEAKGSPAPLEKKLSRFSEFSDWSDEGSDGLLTRSSTPLEQERLVNRQTRAPPTRADIPSSGVDLSKDPTGPTDAPVDKTDHIQPVKTEVDIPSASSEQGFAIKTEPAIDQSLDTGASAAGTTEGGGLGEQSGVGGSDAFQDYLEEISDDELDDIIGDNQEDESQGPETKSITEVDWNSLMKDIQPVATSVSKEQDASKKEEEVVSIKDKFSPANVLRRVGVSRALAGPALMKEIEALCRQGDAASEDKKESTHQPPMFEEQLGALNATANQRYEQRKRLFTDVGPCRRALCARRDIMIRKQLRKDKDMEQVFSNPVIDTELYRLSLQLFRTKRPSLASPLESKVSGLMLKSISVT